MWSAWRLECGVGSLSIALILCVLSEILCALCVQPPQSAIKIQKSSIKIRHSSLHRSSLCPLRSPLRSLREASPISNQNSKIINQNSSFFARRSLGGGGAPYSLLPYSLLHFLTDIRTRRCFVPYGIRAQLTHLFISSSSPHLWYFFNSLSTYLTLSSTLCCEVSTTISGCSGASYGSSMPVNCVISPRRALA